MQLSAEFIDNHIIVKKPRDVGLLYNKSFFGTPLSGNRLELDLLEAVFLVGEGKLQVFKEKKLRSFQSLVQSAAEKIPDFEIVYLAYRDLRKRGCPVKRVQDLRGVHFSLDRTKTGNTSEKKSCYISVFSERNMFTIDEIKTVIQQVSKRNSVLWFVIVDEEGDITYYDVAFVDLKGKTGSHAFPRGVGYLLENRVVVFDAHLGKMLHEKEFFGKPFGDGLQLSLVEALYLMKKSVLTIKDVMGNTTLSEEYLFQRIRGWQPDISSRLLVFSDLKQKGLIVKTGFKFGSHFRAYTKNPEETHAEYLVHVVEKGFSRVWAEISRAVRLAHSVNKDFVFARVENTTIEYIRFGRLRP
ncbi:MAG: tRNA-intron lyase [Methanobacteriota archaeon]